MRQFGTWDITGVTDRTPEQIAAEEEENEELARYSAQLIYGPDETEALEAASSQPSLKDPTPQRTLSKDELSILREEAENQELAELSAQLIYGSDKNLGDKY